VLEVAERVEVDDDRVLVVRKSVALEKVRADMAFTMVERLCGKEVADETARYIE
jgi:hypothetical protein